MSTRSGDMDGCSCLLAALVLVAVFAMGGWALEYVAESWLPLLLDRPVDVPFPHVATVLAGGILSEALIPLALVTWVCAITGII